MKTVSKSKMDATLRKFQKREKVRKAVILKQIGKRRPYTEKEILQDLEISAAKLGCLDGTNLFLRQLYETKIQPHRR